MAKLKSAFIPIYAPFMLLILIHSIYGALTDTLVWMGTLITILTIIIMFAWLAMPQVARTDEYMLPFSLALFAGVVITLSAYLYTDTETIFPLIYTTTNTLFWLGYIFWYSRFDRPVTEVLQVGKVMPQFFVEDVDGYPKHSTSLKGKPTIFMFYRGNWCPMCMGQVREIAGMYQELGKRGVEIALISPQPHSSTRRLAEKYDVPFHFWVDVENRAAQMLGIEQKNGVVMGYAGYASDTVLPTVVITDEEGEIIFVDETDNYRIRPEPQTFLDILDVYRARQSETVVTA